MKDFLLYILFAFLIWNFTFAVRSHEQTEPSYIAYTKNFLRNYPKRLERALALMPVVEGYSAIHAIDPIVPAVVIACESAWKTRAIGEIGEIGLMQVHGQCARGHDLRVAEQQIAAGITCLAAARDACDGSLRQTLTMYQSGSCVARTKTTKRRINHRLWLIKKAREM